jgi:hypothetical protein
MKIKGEKNYISFLKHAPILFKIIVPFLKHVARPASTPTAVSSAAPPT